MDFSTIKFVLIATLPFFLGTLWAIADSASKDFGTTGKKAMWILIASIPFIGFIIYLIFGFRKGKRGE